MHIKIWKFLVLITLRITSIKISQYLYKDLNEYTLTLLDSSSINVIGECMDFFPMSEGRTNICSVVSMRIIKMADLADQTISSHCFLEKHLDISEIRPLKHANARTNILEILL